MSRYDQRDWVITFPNGDSETVFGSAEPRDGVLYIRTYGGISNLPHVEVAYPLVSIRKWEPVSR